MTTSAIAFKRLRTLTPYQRWFVECSYDYTIPDDFAVPPDDPDFYKDQAEQNKKGEA